MGKSDTDVLDSRFRLGERIASGGMASVFEATCVDPADRLADRTLAIKVLHDHLTENPAFVRMFRDEGTIAARFEHAHIVRVHAVAHDRGRHFIVMDRIDGANLSDVLLAYRKRRRRFPKDISFEILRQVLVALSYVHGFKGKAGRKLNIVHRDISPHNILIDGKDRVRLTDFGIARGGHRSEWTETGTVKGKLHYMSPEQARGKRVDARADLYALAVVAWEMFVGRPMTEINDTQQLQRAKISGVINFDDANFQKLSPELRAWISKSLATDPSERHQSAQAMLADMEHLKEAARGRPKEGAMARVLTVLDDTASPEDNQQPLIDVPERSMAASSAPKPVPMMTPQRPMSREFIQSAQRRADDSSPAQRMSRRKRPSRSKVREEKSAAARMSEQISLEAAGVDPTEFNNPSNRKRNDESAPRVSRVYAREQTSLAFATLVAWCCGLLLITGTFLEIHNLEFTPPKADEERFEELFAQVFGGEQKPRYPDLLADEVDEASDDLAEPDEAAAPREAPVQVRNDRFLPRAAEPLPQEKVRLTPPKAAKRKSAPTKAINQPKKARANNTGAGKRSSRATSRKPRKMLAQSTSKRVKRRQTNKR